MNALRSLFALLLVCASCGASAEIELCNDTNSPVEAVILSVGASSSRSKGWLPIPPGTCRTVVAKQSSAQTYYFSARAIGRVATWSGDVDACADLGGNFDYSQNGVPCTDRGPNTRFIKVKKIENAGDAKATQRLSDASNPYVEIAKTGVIQERCLIRYDDSHQVHSYSGPVIELGYQSLGTTTMKKLEHCYKLQVMGPIDVQGVAKAFVDKCVDYGLNHNKTVHVLGLLAAISGDVWGGGGGAYSSAKLTEYVTSATNETINCLTDEAKISEFIKGYLADRFDAVVKEESKWVYWTL